LYNFPKHIVVIINIVIGVHSPAIIRSSSLSPSQSIQSAEVTIPIILISGATSFVISVNTSPSFSNKQLFEGLGYLTGTNRPPTKKSISPSLSKSQGMALELLVIKVGSRPSYL
jgi:hypothetical protein